MTHARRLLKEEDGQDLIEYALLASFLGFAAVVGVGLLGGAMGTTYVSWDNAVQSNALVEVPDPVGPAPAPDPLPEP